MTTGPSGPTAVDLRASAQPAFDAVARRDGVQALHLRIAGRSVELQATGDLLEHVRPAVDHLAAAGPPPLGALRWRMWEDDEHRHPLWDPDAVDAYRLPDGGLVVRGAQDAFVESYRPGHGIDLWGPPGRLHEPDHVVHPAGRAVRAWAATEGLQLLHLGAIVHDGAAALLVGASGAGKTTTTIACATRGDQVLGDDTCLVDVERRVVHSVCATTAVMDDTLERTRTEQAEVEATPRRTSTGKHVLGLQTWGTLAVDAPIAALVVLQPAPEHGEAPGLEPLAPLVAAKALFASSLVPGMPNHELEPWFQDNLRLARQVPAFAVTRGWDLDRVVRQVHEAVAAGRAT